MKHTEEEKSLLALFREMESRAVRDDLLSQAGAMVRAQRALKADYGLAGQDAPQFNGAGAVPGPAA
ncbi:MAG: hypothetical protein LBF80_06245 [Spirochaetaceae bacterium]|nr:hypothetical protein [Spirochaetaceae bacterium]